MSHHFYFPGQQQQPALPSMTPHPYSLPLPPNPHMPAASTQLSMAHYTPHPNGGVSYVHYQQGMLAAPQGIPYHTPLSAPPLPPAPSLSQPPSMSCDHTFESFGQEMYMRSQRADLLCSAKPVMADRSSFLERASSCGITVKDVTHDEENEDVKSEASDEDIVEALNLLSQKSEVASSPNEGIPWSTADFEANGIESNSDADMDDELNKHDDPDLESSLREELEKEENGSERKQLKEKLFTLRSKIKDLPQEGGLDMRMGEEEILIFAKNIVSECLNEALEESCSGSVGASTLNRSVTNSTLNDKSQVFDPIMSSLVGKIGSKWAEAKCFVPKIRKTDIGVQVEEELPKDEPRVTRSVASNTQSVTTKTREVQAVVSVRHRLVGTDSMSEYVVPSIPQTKSPLLNEILQSFFDLEATYNKKTKNARKKKSLDQMVVGHLSELAQKHILPSKNQAVPPTSQPESREFSTMTDFKLEQPSIATSDDKFDACLDETLTTDHISLPSITSPSSIPDTSNLDLSKIMLPDLNIQNQLLQQMMMSNPAPLPFNPSMLAMQQVLSMQNNFIATPPVQTPAEEEAKLDIMDDLKGLDAEDLVKKVLNKPARRKRGRKLRSEKDGRSAVSDNSSVVNEESYSPVESSPLCTLNDELTRADIQSHSKKNSLGEENILMSISKELDPGAVANSLPQSAVDCFLPTGEDWDSELDPYAPEWKLPAKCYIPPPPPSEEHEAPKTSWKTVPGAPGYKSAESQAPYVREKEEVVSKKPFQTQHIMSSVNYNDLDDIGLDISKDFSGYKTLQEAAEEVKQKEVQSSKVIKSDKQLYVPPMKREMKPEALPFDDDSQDFPPLGANAKSQTTAQKKWGSQQDPWQTVTSKKSAAVLSKPPPSRSQAPSPGTQPPASNFEKLVNKLQETFQHPRPELIEIVQEVRAKRGGLKGVTIREVISDCRQVIQERSQASNSFPMAPSAQSPIWGPVDVSNFHGSGDDSNFHGGLSSFGEANDFEEGDECVICCDIIRKGYIRKLECGHVFHPPCIDKWVYEHERTCPTCRQMALFPDDFPHLK